MTFRGPSFGGRSGGGVVSWKALTYRPPRLRPAAGGIFRSPRATCSASADILERFAAASSPWAECEPIGAPSRRPTTIGRDVDRRRLRAPLRPRRDHVERQCLELHDAISAVRLDDPFMVERMTRLQPKPARRRPASPPLLLRQLQPCVAAKVGALAAEARCLTGFVVSHCLQTMIQRRLSLFHSHGSPFLGVRRGPLLVELAVFRRSERVGAKRRTAATLRLTIALP
jgi:hypothetical protein